MDDVTIHPPLINSATPWATTIDQLRALYQSPHTGAITVRTSTLSGFAHNDQIHQYAFYTPTDPGRRAQAGAALGSLNTLGYSPIPLSQTLDNIASIVSESTTTPKKPVIVSITGTPAELRDCIRLINAAQHHIPAQLLVEINLSCPNIAHKPPPAFTLAGLTSYLSALQSFPQTRLKFGIKTPPYSNPANFALLKTALQSFVSADTNSLSIPLHFITATNTLGCSLLLLDDDDALRPQLGSADGSGLGGLAGAPLHPLALGNVRLIAELLRGEPALAAVKVFGVGGVSDAKGFARMRAVGADVVGVGTALGVDGVAVFEKILKG